MKPLAYPITDFSVTFEKIISRKHEPFKGTLNNIKQTVIQREVAYINNMKALKSTATANWQPNQVDALQKCYTSDTEGLGILKDHLLSLLSESKVNNNDFTVCPYCLLRKPDSWDHHLPKEKYPELSVAPRNLIYVCTSCNRRKHADFDENLLKYVNPYFYDGPQTPILHCLAKIENGRLKLRFICHTSNQNFKRFSDICQRHIDNLSLESDYQLEASSIVSRFIEEISIDFPGGIAEDLLKNRIRKEFVTVSDEFGINAWEARLWHCLYHLTGFHTYVLDEIANNPHTQRDGLDLPAIEALPDVVF